MRSLLKKVKDRPLGRLGEGMTGWLVVNEFLNNNKFNEIHRWLVDAAIKQNISLEIKTNGELMVILSNRTEKAAKYNIPEVDFILFWDKDIRLAYYLEQLGYKVFNSAKSIAISDDKSLTHLTLMPEGIPMAKTIIAPMTFENIGFTNLNFIDKVVRQLGFPLVLKEAFGSFGQQVYLIEDMKKLLEKLSSLGARPIIFQEYIKSSHGRDLRLQVVGKQVVASMMRISQTGDFRANLSIGGKMEAYKPTKEQCELAIQSSRIMGLDFAGVDLLFGEDDQVLVCEVNSNAHFKNIYDCTGVNVADEIISYISTSLKK